MASGKASWIQRNILFKTPLFKKGPCGNYHKRGDVFCYCRVQEYSSTWNGGLYSFATQQEVKLEA